MKNFILICLVAVIAMFTTSCNNALDPDVSNVSKIYGTWVQTDTDSKGEFDLRTISVTIRPDKTYHWEDTEDGYVEEEFDGTWEYMEGINVIVLKWTDEEDDLMGFDYAHVADDFKSFRLSPDDINEEPEEIPFIKQ